MTVLKIRCGRCRRVWNVYERGLKAPESRVCPNCGAEIDAQTWERQILQAVGQVADTNRELYKDHTGYRDQALFTISVEGR